MMNNFQPAVSMKKVDEEARENQNKIVSYELQK